VNGCASDTSSCWVEEVCVDQVCRDLFKVTLTGLDDLTAGQGSWVDTTVSVTLDIGSLVRLTGSIVHGVSKLDVPDTVSSLCTLGWGDKFADWAVWLTLLCEWWVGRGVCLTRCTVAEDQDDIFVSDITDLFKFYGRVHLIAPGLGDSRLSWTILWCICHCLSLQITRFHQSHDCMNNFCDLLA
jgi:hypothetical protein